LKEYELRQKSAVATGEPEHEPEGL
jgi:hypothetical protein